MKKLFSEFASCWGGVAVTPTAEPAAAPPRPTAERRRSKRTAKVTANNWKPNLNAISENSPMSDAVAAAAAGEKRRPAKPKIKSPARAAPPSNVAEDYWKYSQTMELPAFAPTSYLF